MNQSLFFFGDKTVKLKKPKITKIQFHCNEVRKSGLSLNAKSTM